MNRERISDALNRLDARHISETMVFAPDAMQGAAERSKTMHNRTHRSTSHRFGAILVAVCLVFSLGVVAYAAVESGWFSGRDPEIAPTNTQQFAAEAGFEPIRVHGFPNGYTCINSMTYFWAGHDHVHTSYGGELEEQDTFAVVGATIADNFGLDMPEGCIGTSLLDKF